MRDTKLYTLAHRAMFKHLYDRCFHEFTGLHDEGGFSVMIPCNHCGEPWKLCHDKETQFMNCIVRISFDLTTWPTYGQWFPVAQEREDWGDFLGWFKEEHPGVWLYEDLEFLVHPTTAANLYTKWLLAEGLYVAKD